MQRRDFLKSTAVLGAGALPFLRTLPASAASNGTAVVVIGQTINSLDIHRSGTNRPSYQVAVNVYDRLVSFGTKTLPDGSLSYDYSVIEPEIAESWSVARIRPISAVIEVPARPANSSAVTTGPSSRNSDSATTVPSAAVPPNLARV